MNDASFLKGQLEKPTEDSKKWKAMIIGLKGIAGMFIIGMGAMLFKPELAASSTGLVQFGFTAWGGIIGIYLGAQGSVDFKTTAAIQQINREEKRDETMTLRQEDLEQNAKEKFRDE